MLCYAMLCYAMICYVCVYVASSDVVDGDEQFWRDGDPVPDLPDVVYDPQPADAPGETKN